MLLLRQMSRRALERKLDIIEVRITTRQMFANDEEVKKHLDMMLAMGYPLSFIEEARIMGTAFWDCGDSVSELTIKKGN